MSKILTSTWCSKLRALRLIKGHRELKNSVTGSQFWGDHTQLRLLGSEADNHRDLEKLISHSKDDARRLSDIRTVKAFFENMINAPSCVPLQMKGETATEKIANLDENQKKIFRMIQKEYDYMKSTEFKVPFSMDDNIIWVQLLECNDRQARKKVLATHYAEKFKNKALRKRIKMYRNNFAMNQTPISGSVVCPEEAQEEGTEEAQEEGPEEADKEGRDMTKDIQPNFTDNNLELSPPHSDHTDRTCQDTMSDVNYIPHPVSDDKLEDSLVLNQISKQFNFRQMKAQWNQQKYLNSKKIGIPLIFDMTKIKRMSNLKSEIYGALRTNYEQLDDPFDVMVCNMSDEDVAEMTTDVDRSAYFHYDHEFLDADAFSSKPYYELHDPENLVYITPTANRTDKYFEFDPSKVYIIGNRSKTDIINETNRMNIPRVKLPLSFEFKNIELESHYYQQRRQIGMKSKHFQPKREEQMGGKRQWKMSLMNTILILSMRRKGWSWRHIIAEVYPHEYQKITF